MLQALPLQRVNRYVTRFIFEAYRGTALDAPTLRALGTNRAELAAFIADKGLGSAAPQLLGRVAHDTGRIEGLLVWSRVSTREKNLILFPDRLGMRYDLHDPTGELPSVHPAIMEAIRILMQID